MRNGVWSTGTARRFSDASANSSRAGCIGSDRAPMRSYSRCGLNGEVAVVPSCLGTCSGLGSISGASEGRRTWLAPRGADNPSMSSRSEVCESDVEAPPVVFCDRRRRPNRRVSWRGGRRDNDWLNRPSGVLDRFQRLQRGGGGWRRLIQTSRAFMGRPERRVHDMAA